MESEPLGKLILQPEIVREMVRSVSEVDKIFGMRLRAARLSAQMTQLDLAKSIRSSFQQIQKYEAGQNRISASALIHLARALHLPITYFFDELVPNGKPPNQSILIQSVNDAAVSRFARSVQGTALLRKFRALKKDEIRQQFLDLLESIIRQTDLNSNIKSKSNRSLLG